MNTDLMKRYLQKTVGLVLIVLAVLFGISVLLVDVSRVDGPSMEPTLYDQDLLLINKLVYLTTSPKRYDIVQLIRPEGDPSEDLLVKRVIGLPGETVVLQDGRVLLEQEQGELRALDESYLGEGVVTAVQPGQETRIEVPEYSYFVLGDNRPRSASDSRSFGVVHRSEMNGRVSQASSIQFRFWTNNDEPVE